jgi:hypothetical protein
MSHFELVPDKQYPNAVTLHTPEGKKIRVSEYKDGRLRLRLAKAGPMLVQECYLTGAGDDVILSLVPEGWKRGPSEKTPNWKLRAVISQPFLTKAGISIVNETDLRLACNKCSEVWSPNILPGGGLAETFWHCPKGCNVSKE